MKKTFTLLLAACLTGITGCAQEVEKAKLDAYFAALAANDKFMGSVAVSKDGKLLYATSVGFADVEHGRKATGNSKYRIGSVSKIFTAVLVFKAVEEGKLHLNQTIDRFFPTITNADRMTVAHLLYHRSGIHNFTDDACLEWNTQPKTEQEMITIITDGGSDFEPDTEARYSNSNFVLLAYILEKVYQKSYSEILKEKIVIPAKLKNTCHGTKINTQNDECYSYKYNDGWKMESETDMSIPLGAGSIVSTPADLNLFGEALFAGRLVSANSLQQMKTIKDNFGMGLLQMPFYEQLGFGHTGGIDGFRSLFAYFPDSRIVFAYTSNGINFNGNDIAIAVLSAVCDKPFEIPEFTTFDVKEEELDKYLGIYSSQQLPLKMTISKADGKLTGQATGQPSFPLEPTAKDKFRFEQAGVVLEFHPANETMILKQGGGIFHFKKEK